MNLELLSQERVSEFILLYKEFYAEAEGQAIPKVTFENWLKYFLPTMNNPDSLNIIAINGDKIVGFITAQQIFPFDGVKTMSIDSLYVTPMKRKLGIGKSLIADLLKCVKVLGVRRIYVGANLSGSIWEGVKTLGFVPWKLLLVKEEL